MRTLSVSRSASMLLFLMFSAVLASCSGTERSDARGRYNHGIDLLAEGDLDRAETAFLDARSRAGVDQSLRYSAAFNLGMLYARRATDLQESEPEKALSELQSARNWFQDAANVESDDKDSRANLQIVARRAQVLADQLNKGEKTLEARLGKVIDNERALRDQVRGIMESVERSGQGADPIGFRDAFGALATSERELMADTGVVGDLAADELSGLDGQDQDKMQQQDKVRQIQLRNLDAYLQSARVALDDTRRQLRKLDGHSSHLRATAALALLKRARAQLLDPVAALKGVAQDQREVFSFTQARLALVHRQVVMPGDPAKKAATAKGPPAWLDSIYLGERQVDVLERTSEILAQFQAASGAPPPDDESKVDPKTARMLEMASQAAPFLEAAVGVMGKARDSLATDALPGAVLQETEAMRNLLRAIEHFSDLRNLIELTYAEQQSVVMLLDPEQAEANPAALAVEPDKRGAEVLAAERRNVDRVERMRALIVEQRSAAVAKSEEGGEEAKAQAAQTFDLAEKHRAGAKNALSSALTSLQILSQGGDLAVGTISPLVSAQTALTELEELRRIFFSIVEHLKELHRNQAETYDRTGELQAKDDSERGKFLPPLADSQKEYATFADALATALEKQADAASASDDAKAAQQGQTFADAAVEVRSALDSLRAASRVLSQAVQDSGTMSVDLSPALEEQPKALEHIQAAIDILQPPKPKDQKQQDKDKKQQDKDKKQQKQDKKQQQEKEISKQQADRKLQEIRDREAARQHKREEAQAAQGASVEKDW